MNAEQAKKNVVEYNKKGTTNLNIEEINRAIDSVSKRGVSELRTCLNLDSNEDTIVEHFRNEGFNVSADGDCIITIKWEG